MRGKFRIRYGGVYSTTCSVLWNGRVEAKLWESVEARIIGVCELVRLHRANHVKRRRCGDIDGCFVWYWQR